MFVLLLGRFPRLNLAPGAWRLVLTLVLGVAPARAGLALHAERATPFDLAVTGKLTDVPVGQTRYVRWSDLRALPSQKIRLDGEFVKGEQELTIVFLSEIWRGLPRSDGADTLLATCTDGYASVYPGAFIETYRPFVILEINGKGPGDWPPPGVQYNPGPYVIFISPTVEPAVASLLDVGHKNPWGVTTLEVASYDERFAGVHQGRWASLSPKAEEGREIWIHSCTSCHKGPGGSFGGSKSDRPFEVLGAHAAYNQAYFKRYVHDPQSVVAGAKMQAHPHYSDAQLDALIAFIIAEPKPAAAPRSASQD